MDYTGQMSHQSEHYVEQQLPSEAKAEKDAQGREDKGEEQCDDIHHTDAAPLAERRVARSVAQRRGSVVEETLRHTARKEENCAHQNHTIWRFIFIFMNTLQ